MFEERDAVLRYLFFIRRRIDVYTVIRVVLQRANDTGGMMASEGSQPFTSLFGELLSRGASNGIKAYGLEGNETCIRFLWLHFV
jgi:hypothetical protein